MGDHEDQIESAPVIAPIWQTVAGWCRDNPTTVVAALSGVGFVTGAAVIAAFAAGLGAAPSDLGLDLQATLTVAAASLVFPVLLAAAFVWSRPDHAGHQLIVAVLMALAVTIAFWWHTGRWKWALLVLAVAVTVGAATRGMRGRAQGLADDGPPRSARELADFAKSYWAILMTSVVVLVGGAFFMGRNIRNDDDTVWGPVIVRFVLPVHRGIVAVNDRLVCVDRVGDQVMVGKNAIAVVPDWDGFLITDCERGYVSILLD